MDRSPAAPTVVPHRRLSPTLVVLVALPAATLLAGVATIRITGAGSLDAVGDPVRRTAQVQVADLGPDQRAAAAGRRAVLQVRGGEVRVLLDGTALPTSLRLGLEHPLDASRDRDIVLVPRDGAWIGRWPGGDVAWHLALGPVDGEWRVVGRWQGAGATRLELRPALAD